MPSYFRRLSASVFEPTAHVGGAWQTDEQHVAPVMGLLAHLVETEHRSRRSETALALARVNYDILGVVPMVAFEVETRVVRQGRTIELIEATLTQAGRAALVLRAWMLQSSDTSEIAGTPLVTMPEVDEVPEWHFGSVWPGGAVRSIDVRSRSLGTGRGHCWLRPRVPLLEDEPISSRARMFGVLDFANGIATRVPPEEAYFPNVDLTASIFRDPSAEWIGLDTTVSFGADGTGLTETVLSDVDGPFGTSSQTLTIRMR